MKVLRIGLWVPVPPPLGGIARWGQRYLSAAAQHSLQVEVINISPPPGDFSEKSAFRVDRLAPATRALRQLGTALAQRRLDVVHVTTTLFWATPRDALTLAMCRGAGVPTVLHIHASTQMIAWHQGLPAWRRRGLESVLRMASCVLVLSEELELYLTSRVPGLRLARIGNMVETQQPLGDPVLPAKARPRVLFVGALTPLKGVTELAQAMLGIPQAELCLVGGPGHAIDPQRLVAQEAALAALRQTGQLVEVGELTPDQTLRAYREADVFCLPSWREGLPNVLLEAMAAGLPAVVTPVGAIAEVVAGDLAEVVAVGDAAATQAALLRLLDSPQRRSDLAARAQAVVQARYGIDTIMRRYRAVYEQVLAG